MDLTGLMESIVDSDEEEDLAESIDVIKYDYRGRVSVRDSRFSLEPDGAGYGARMPRKGSHR